MTEEKTASNGLSQNSSLREVFEFVDLPEGQMNIMPITVKQDEEDTRLAIFIRGPHDEASMVMAKLIGDVQDLFDKVEQKAATEEDKKFVLTK